MSRADRPIYECGQIVYLKVDTERVGMVTGEMKRPNGYVYYVTWEDLEETPHFGVELTIDPGFVVTAET